MLTAELDRSGFSPQLLDRILGIQLSVALVGEALERDQGLSWWKSQLADEGGGADLFERLTRASAVWTRLDAVRRAAQTVDAQLRRQFMGATDDVRTLFHLGFDVDEALDERLRIHKRAAADVREVFGADPLVWSSNPNRQTLNHYLDSLSDDVSTMTVPGGREIRGTGSIDPERLVQMLAVALRPLTPDYPMPFYRTVRK